MVCDACYRTIGSLVIVVYTHGLILRIVVVGDNQNLQQRSKVAQKDVGKFYMAVHAIHKVPQIFVSFSDSKWRVVFAVSSC